MRLRKRHLPLVALLGAAAAVLPAVASSETTTPTVSAVVVGSAGGIYETFAWSPAQVEIGSGGAVTFSTGSTTEPHGIVWTGGPGTPTCDSTVPVGEGHFNTNWSGSCSFSREGVYTFHCSVHEYMTGKVVVSAAGVTTTTTTSSPPPTPTSTAPPSGGSSTSPSTPTNTQQLTKSQKLAKERKLAKALKACRKKPKSKRAACMKRARKRFR